MQHPTGEALRPREGRTVRAAEGAGRRDDCPCRRPATAVQVDNEPAPVRPDPGDAAAGADVHLQASGMGGEVGNNLTHSQTRPTAALSPHV
ncbi:hypothetical protein ACWGIU_01095, partial [Streptomyces sp. NPDC054840]